MFGKYFMCNFQDNVNIDSIENTALRKLWKCDWTRADVERNIRNWLLSVEDASIETELTKAEAEQQCCDAIQLTLIFVQYNFTGPFNNLSEFEALCEQLELKKHYNAMEQLSMNGEEVNDNTNLGELLVLAINMFNRLFKQFPDNLYLHWWRLRLLQIQQHLLSHYASDLYELLKSTKVRLLSLAENIADIEQRAFIELEILNAYTHYRRYTESDKLHEALSQTLNVTLEIQGLLGLRTKFQQKPLPQLLLQVKQAATDEMPPTTTTTLPKAAVTHGSTNLPKLLMLDDDTRLERIKFLEPQDDEAMTLPSLLQALVLAKVILLKIGQPGGRLNDEEMEPYHQTLLYQLQGPLQIRLKALLLNCVRECKYRRTVERSWKQCEEVVKFIYDHAETAYTLYQRLSYAFAAPLTPYWSVQYQLCELQLSLGMTKSALDTYLKLHNWQAVIECYTRLELKHKAAEVIRQQIELKPSVTLYCLLGDAEDDVQHYESAWKFSKERSSMAQAYWGAYYFRHQKYTEALPHLRKSVEINSLQQTVWQRVGYIAIVKKDWQLAATAYLTYTHLEPGDFQAWNNLAKVFINLGDKSRAHKIMVDALKCNYNSAKVWENFMIISLATHYYSDTIKAYKRLMELDQRFLDVEMLARLTVAMTEGESDANGVVTNGTLLKAMNELLGQVCIKHGNVAMLWEMAAHIAPTSLKRAQKLNRAYRAHINHEPAWSGKPSELLNVLKLCQELCKISLEAYRQPLQAEGESMGMVISQLNSARLTANGCVLAAELFLNSCLDALLEQRATLEEIKKLQIIIEKELNQTHSQ